MRRARHRRTPVGWIRICSTAVAAMAVVALVGYGVTSTGGSHLASPSTTLDASTGASPSEGHSPELTQQLSGPLSGTGLRATHGISSAMRAAISTSSSTPLNGVDVSVNQGSINWTEVAGAGYNFASIKATEGNYYVDPDYATDASKAEAAGMYVAPYHFANPPKSTGAAQADYAYDNAGDYKVGGLNLPLVLDIEPDPYAAADDTNECYGFSASAMVNWISSFVAEADKDTGALPIIYTTQNWWATCTGNSTAFTSDPLWAAAYSPGTPGLLPYGTDWAMWQYSSAGTVPGISTNVDLDYFSGSPLPETSLTGASTSVQLQTLSGLAGQSVSYTATGLPTGVSMNGTGLISGTPTTPGTYDVTVTPSASTTVVPASLSFTWVVTDVLVTLPPEPVTIGGSPVSFQLHATESGVTGNPSYSASGLPTGLTVSTSGLVSGWASTPGAYPVTVTATNGAYSGSTSFEWVVEQAGDSGPTGHIVLDNGGKCIDDPNGSTANGTRIQIYSCDNADHEQWTIVQDQTVRVLNHECLDDANGGTANGNPVQLYNCGAGNVNQRWIVETDGELVNVKSGKCLDDSGYKTANETKLQIWSCTGATNQRWTTAATPLETAVGDCVNAKSTSSGGEIESWSCTGGSVQAVTVEPDGTLRIAGKCVAVSGNGTASGTKIELWTCLSNNIGQQWRLSGNGSVVNPHSGKCLTDPSSSAANGVALEITACPSTPALGTSWHVM